MFFILIRISLALLNYSFDVPCHSLAGVFTVGVLPHTPSGYPLHIAYLSCNLQFEHFSRDKSWAEEKKMGAFLSVSRGSEEPLKFVEVEYRGGEPNSPPIAIVGKGVTFDR